MGYGTRALQALDAYYSGQLLNLDEAIKANGSESFEQASRVKPVCSAHEICHGSLERSAQGTDLHNETIRVRDPSKMPPLLHRLSDVKPEQIDWLGASFGLTPTLFRFWKRSGYVPLYLRQTENELTGEHTCVVLRGLSSTKEQTAPWLSAFAQGARPSPCLRSPC
jgi:N-acetyltransferase 10